MLYLDGHRFQIKNLLFNLNKNIRWLAINGLNYLYKRYIFFCVTIILSIKNSKSLLLINHFKSIMLSSMTTYICKSKSKCKIFLLNNNITSTYSKFISMLNEV